MRCLGDIWFCAGHGNVGIVKVFDDHDGVKYYIGECSGISRDADIRHIMALGSRFPDKAGETLFGSDTS